MVTSAEEIGYFDSRAVFTFTIDRTERQIEEDELMLDVLEAGGEELRIEEDLYEVFTEPEHFEEVKTALESKYPISSAEVTMLPNTYAAL